MHRQTGFTLIEVMVTVIVLAIGLLGLAGLQATSLAFNSTAYQRSQATSLAYDIADRMRANVVEARNGNYNVNIGFTDPGTATVAATDLGQWRRALINALPAGTGVICRGTIQPPPSDVCNPSAAGTNVFTIRIRWDDSRGQADFQRFDMMTEL